MKEVLRFQLGKGVGGIRIDAVPFLFEYVDGRGNYPDEPESGLTDDPDSYSFLSHVFTQDQPGMFDMTYQWRAVIDEFKDKVLLIEAYTNLENLMKLYGDGKGRDGGHIPFNFELLTKIKKNSTAKDIYELIQEWNRALPAGRFSNWVVSF